MSPGDDEPTEEPEPTDTADQGSDDEPTDLAFDDQYAAVQTAVDALTGDDADPDPESFATALDAIEAALPAAETEADLDRLDAALDDVEDALTDAAFPEPDDEEDRDPSEELEATVATLRTQLDDHRGPYPEDITGTITSAAEEIEDTRWTDTGQTDLHATVSSFIDTVTELLATDQTVDEADLPGTLESVTTAITDADLDPDADTSLLTSLRDATDDLAAGVDAAEAWSDLTTREQLDAEGFYDVLEHRKDFPPEWHALKVWEKQGNADMILLALDALDMDFMEEHCLDALRRLGDTAAVDPMLERATRRDKPAIEILGKIGDERALDTILEYVDTDSDPQLQKITLKALGEIGSPDATQAVANKLQSENDRIRSRAARSLGLIGDPRAIKPLTATLESDESESVRASAAWALNHIGTEHALEALREFADDRSYLVQAEAEHALTALGARPA